MALDAPAPTARYLARVRKEAAEMNLPVTVADDVAARHDDMASARAALEGRARDAASIRSATAMMSLPPALAETLIAAGKSIDEARDAIIEAKAMTGDAHEHPPRSRAEMGIDWTGGAGLAAKTVAGIEALIDPRSASPMGRNMLAGCGGTLGDVAMAYVRATGERPLNLAHAAQMAMHSRSDFPLHVGGAVGNVVGRMIEQAPPAILEAAHEIEKEDYQPGRNLVLTASGVPEEVREGGEIRFTSLNEAGEDVPVPVTFAAGMNFSEQLVVNSSIDLLQGGARAAYEGCIERQRAVLVAPLLANSGAGQTMTDGNAWFHTSRGNTLATAPLSLTTLSTARQILRRQTDSKGAIRPVEPWAVVVPPELETVAQQLFANIIPESIANANPFANGALKVIVEPGLTAPATWYLLGDPSRYDGLALSYLGGQRAPTGLSGIPCVVWHSGIEGDHPWLAAKTPAYPTRCSTSFWRAPIRRPRLIPEACSTC